MDLAPLLLWIVGLTSVNALLQAIGMRRRGLRPVTMPFVVLLVASLAVGFTDPTGPASLVVFAAFVVVVLLPAVLGGRLRKMVNRGDFARANRIAGALGKLRPSLEGAVERRVLEALALAQRGERGAAEAHLTELARGESPAGRHARAQMLAVAGRFDETVTWLERGLPARTLAEEPGLLVAYLRALGEVGRRSDLLAIYRRFEKLVDHPANAATRDTARLIALAFGGRVAGVSALLRGPLDAAESPNGRAWLATAELAAGRVDAAERELRTLAAGPDGRARDVAMRRLERLDEMPEPLRIEDVELLDRIEELVTSDERFGRGAGGRRPVATYALVALNLAVFGLQIVRGATQDPFALFALGAMHPAAVLAGEVHRLVTYEFLHFGVLHLAMNMLALSAIGPFVERSLGPLRLVVVFLFAGLAGSVGSVLLYVLDLGRTGILVGASGGIMGLVGAETAVLLLGWLRHRALSARARLRSIGIALGLQVVFDLSTPQISFLAHSTGVVAGAALGVLLVVTRRDPAALGRPPG